MKALILIGGLGTRLRPLTYTTPKPMLPLLNRPFLTYQMDLIKKYGIKDVIFCLSYLPRAFKEYFRNGQKWGMKIRYVLEDEPLGTGGAVKNAQDYIDESTIVFNGDILTDLDLRKFYQFHKKCKAILTIALSRVNDPTLYGLVEIDKKGKIEQFIEKPTWNEVTCNTINAGIYVFEPEVLKYIPPEIHYSLERSLFPNLLDENERLYGYVSKEYWLDIGTLDKYLQAHFDILEGKLNCNIPGHRITIKHPSLSNRPCHRITDITGNIWTGKNVKINKDINLDGKLVVGDNTKIHQYVQIRGMVSIGKNCSIGKGVFLSDCVILDNVKIDEGAKLEKCLVDTSCHIGLNAVLGEGTAIGKGTVIKPYSRL